MGLPPFDEAVTGLPTLVQLREMQTAFEDTAEDLKHTMKALAASQADLTAMQSERDRAIAQAEKLRGCWAECSRRRDDIQAALTRVEAELHDAGRTAAEFEQAYTDAKTEARVMREAADRYLDSLQDVGQQLAAANYQNRLLTRQLKAVTAERDKVLAENDLHGHQLADVTDYLQRSRTWQVARQDAGACFRCDGPIVRSQAVEPQPGTTKGSYSHVECPDPTPTKENR